MSGRNDAAILVFLTEPLANPERAYECVRECFGDDVSYIKAAEIEDEQELVESAAKAEGILLLAPGVECLKRLARGEGKTFVERLTLRALLWGIDVHIWLDFPLRPRHKALFFREIADSVHILEEMGVNVSVCLCVAEEKTPPTLVTEREVMAHEPGSELICAKGAVITPLAKDRATEKNIRIRSE